MNSTRAKKLANWYSHFGEAQAMGSIYADGAVLFLCLSEGTLKKLVAELDDGFEMATSDDGFCTAIIVNQAYETAFNIANFFADLKYLDLRLEDRNSIESLISLIGDI